jgi:hypothetical protein
MDGSLVRAFLPGPPEIADSESHRALRRRSAWSSTLIVGLELANAGGDFEAIRVARRPLGHRPEWHGYALVTS